MNPPAQFSHLRLWLYLGANCLPAVVQWLTLNFDTTPRGLLILSATTLMTACITTRAYLDGKTTEPVAAAGRPGGASLPGNSNTEGAEARRGASAPFIPAPPIQRPPDTGANQ